MTTGQIFEMLDDAWSIGMTDYIVWGGEPLLRDDLPEMLAYANQKGLDSTLITNGSLLPEKIHEIAQDLYGLIVSIDHPDPQTHDRLRRNKGIYERAVEGIRQAKEYENLNLFINCVIQKGNTNQLEEMVKLADKMAVKISFEMVEVVENYNEKLVPSRREIATAAFKLIKLKNAGYPIVNSSSYFQALAERRKYSCQAPKVLVTVRWDGRVRVCSNIAEDAKPALLDCDLGNVTEKSFADIFRSESYKRYVEAAEKCWKCDLSYPREIALVNSFNREAIWNFVSKII